MDRRQYLARLGTGLTVGTAALAGCTSPGAEEATETGGSPVGAGETETGTTETGTPSTETEAAGDGTETVGNETAGNETGGTGTGTDTSVPDSIAMITDGSEYLFDPIGLYVEPGETITWVNESGSHSSTAYTEDNPQSDVNRIPNDAEGWNSGILSEEGAEFTHTFEVQGTYDYYCIPHKSLGMVARLVVGEPSGVEGDPPDGPVPSEQRIVEERVVTQEEFNP